MSATNWSFVPAPGDYEDGEFCGKILAGETEVLGEKVSQRHFVSRFLKGTKEVVPALD
jgi:hypothetical protein